MSVSRAGRRGLFRAAVLVAGLTLAGRVLGFVRDVVIAHQFGATAETDAFLVAWTVPETAAPLLLESAVLYALIPVLVRAQELERVPRLAVDRTLGPLLIAVGSITALVALAAPLIVAVVAPGLVEEALATRSVRVASLTVFGFGAAGFMVAALRSREVFGIPASVYLAYNVGIIGTILLLHGEEGVFSAAIGLAVGSALMVIVQLPSFLRQIGRPRLRNGSFSYTARELAPFVPIAIFVLLRHSQVYVERFASSLVEPGAISFLNYAERVTQVPLGLAIAVGVVTFPAMARSAVAESAAELRATFERNLRLVVLIAIPAAVVLTAFASPLIEVLFERGSFTAADTDATAEAMQFYAWGLVAQCVMAVAALPVFAVRRQMREPILSAGIGVAVTIVAAAVGAPLIGLPGVALASAIGVTVMAVDLVRRVHERILPFDIRGVGNDLLKLGAAGAAGLALALAITPLLPDTAWSQALIGSLTVAAVYLAAAALLDAGEVRSLLRRARDRVRGGAGG